VYEQFYGLTDKPFSLTPNPRFVFYSRQYREAEGQLLYGINSREGFMLVTGQPGTGKTTLCRDLIEKLDSSKIHSALIFNPFLNGIEMLAALLTEFGLAVPNNATRKDLLDRLNQFLLAQLGLGKSCVAIFDEAQHLTPEFLEQIRVLSNLETDQEKLIQIVLVGQPELLDKIRTPTMAQLDQRVSIRCTLTDLDEQETDRYIHHRLNVAGARGQIRFSPKAVDEIYRASHGVPRLINLICDRALLAGYAAQTRDIGPAEVRKGVLALRGEEAELVTEGKAVAAPRRGWRRPAVLLGIAGLVAAVTAAITLLPGRFSKPDAEALYWRGTLAAAPAEAETALRALLTQYPQSPRVNDALLRLAQIEMGRGDRRAALQSLALLAQHASGKTHARALLMTSRVQLDGGDTTAACRTAGGDFTAAVAGDVALSQDYSQLTALCGARAPGAAAVADTTSPAAAATVVTPPASTPPPVNPPKRDSLAKPHPPAGMDFAAMVSEGPE
jgi:type II secretory pathway predicted ATPase ExeA